MLSDRMFECRCICCSHSKSGPNSGFSVFSFAVFHHYITNILILSLYSKLVSLDAAFISCAVCIPSRYLW